MANLRNTVVTGSLRLASHGAGMVRTDANGTISTAAMTAGDLPSHNHDDRYYTESEINSLLSAKQDAATAITTSNIGSQSVNYANSAGTSGQVSGVSVSSSEIQYLKNTLDSTSLPYKCDIYVDGDPNTYYPVHFIWGDQDVWRRIIIKRGYSEEAPWDPIGTGAHRGGLLLDWEGNFGGWGGAEYSDRLRVFNESYTNICADMYIYTHSMGYVFMLRGGHALYHIFSDQPIRGYHQTGTPDIAYNTSTLFYDHSIAGYRVYAPAPVTSVNSSRIDGLRTKKQSLFDGRYQPLENQRLSTGNSPSFSSVSANDVYTTGGWFRNHTNNSGIYWSNTGWHLMPENNADFRFHSGNGSESAIRMETSGTTRGYMYANSSNEIGFLNNSRTWRLRVYSGGAVESYGDFRAPIFYDSENTAYYLDPASTSNILAAYIGRVLINHDGTDTWFRMQSGNRMRVTTTGGNDFIIPNTGNITFNGTTLATREWVQAQGYRTTDSDNQTLSVSGSTLTISGGNSVTLPTGGISQSTADGRYTRNLGQQVYVGSLNDLDGAYTVNLDGYGPINTAGGPDTAYNASLWGIGNSGRGAQIYLPYAYDQMYFRRGAGGWSSWFRVLNTSGDPYPSNMNQYVRTSDSVSFQNIYATAAAGRVSAGSTSIDGMLFDSSRAALIARGNYPHLELWSDVSNSNHGGTIRFGGYDNGSSGAYKSWNIGTPGSNLYFLDIGYGGYNSNPHAGIAGLGDGYGYPGAFTIMRFHNNGNIGVGNFGTYGNGDNDPDYKLDVRGNGRYTGLLYLDASESLNLYGIRGRFSNEYIHLYNKVGIGHPGGWGQGEGNTPNQGLSTYGGINIAYANDNGATINTYTRINKNWGGGDYGAEQLTIRGTYPSIALRSTQHNNVWLIHNDDLISFYYGGGVDNNSWSRRFFIPTDGNIWMSWAGDNISNLLAAKQNASTAITTSNIGSQSVNYATSATRLYASDSPYRFGDSAPYYLYMNYDGGSYWELKVTPATPGTVRVAYANSSGTASQVSINYNNDSNSTYQLLWGSGNSVYGTSQVYINPSSDIIYARGGYVSPGNSWGTSDSAFFPNGITTAGGTNWVYGHTYLGNAPSNGSGAEISSSGRIYVRNGNTSGTWGFAGLFIDRNNAANNYVPFSFENEYGNHSWGLVARFHVQGTASDRPSIQFSSGYSNTRWSVGYCYPDDNFRITQNHGMRPDNSTNDGWGTERIRVNTDGNTLIFASLGIGGITPDVRLSVSGDAHVSNILYLGGSAGTVNSWGTRTYGNSGDWTNNSRTVRFDNVGYGSNWSFTIDSSGNVQSSASITASGLIRVNGNTNLYLDYNYGQSIVGAYSSYRYQGVFAMGDAYKLPIDGTGPGNLYGMAWSHPNAGGVASNLNTHGLLVMENGTFLAAISGSIRARDDVRAPALYDSGSRVAISRGEGRNYVDYSRYVYNNGAYSGSGWIEPSDLGVRYANTSGRADQLGAYAACYNDTHPGYGMRVWYNWNYCDAYMNGFTIGSHPGDTYYGWQMYQRMWNDRTYTRRYNGGFQSERMLLTAQDDPYAYNMNQYVRTSDGVTFSSVSANDVYTTGGWFRNHTNNNGIYWSNTGWHLYPYDTNDFYMRSGSNESSIRFLRSDGTVLGYVHNASDYAMGFLTSGRSWRLRVENGGRLQAYGPIARNAHASGFLEGSYNNIGGNSSATNPIYTIGSSYNPSDYSLSNMYGIGYAHSNMWGGGKVDGWGMYVCSAGNIDAVIGGDGASTSIWARTDIVAYSDARVKENVEVVENALEKVQSMRGVTFTRNDVKDTTKRSAGVIAQEVLPIFPEVVSGTEKDMYSVAYGNMAALFIEAIKEQQHQIESLKLELKELKEKN